MTSLIAAVGSGRSISVIPAVPAAWSVTTIAFIGVVSSIILLRGSLADASFCAALRRACRARNEHSERLSRLASLGWARVFVGVWRPSEVCATVAGPWHRTFLLDRCGALNAADCVDRHQRRWSWLAMSKP